MKIDSINTFIDTEWTPLFLSKAVKNKAFRQDIEKGNDLSEVLLEWSKEVQFQINRKRENLLKLIN